MNNIKYVGMDVHKSITVRRDGQGRDAGHRQKGDI